MLVPDWRGMIIVRHDSAQLKALHYTFEGEG